jgi:excisionase family DNA binding protein
MTENEHTMSLDDAAEMFGCSKRTIRDKIKRRGLPAVKPGRDLRFSRRELLEWQDKQRPTPKPAPEPTPEK